MDQDDLTAARRRAPTPDEGRADVPEPGSGADPATTPEARAPAQPAGAATLRVEVGWATIGRVVAAILLTLLALQVVQAMGSLLTLLALSFFFSLALDPAVRHLHRRFGWRRGAAVGVIFVAGLGFLVFLVWVLIPGLALVADRLSTNFDDWLLNLRTWSGETFGVEVPSMDVVDEAPAAGEVLGQYVDDPFGAVLGVASAGVSMVFTLATMAMFIFSFTAGMPAIQQAVLRLFSPRNQERIGWTWDTAIVQTGAYFYSRMILMVINGIGFLVTMVVVGVPVSLALPVAVFASFVSVFIPAVGTYIGGAVPSLITLALLGLVPALVVLGYVLVYQQIENYWLSPRISAETMSLNGGVAFGAAIAGGAIAGPVGAFVALPVAALIAATISNATRSHEVVYRSSLDDDTGEPDPDGGTTRTRGRRRRRSQDADDGD